ncbi:FecR family protein [Brevundimonas sp. SORGH_AS_0993]|uniref:FecR family protein n=1 Tax=Brevundimonas sp. SORGH_AS_0993 TaxID=3041794 RepID=UPI002785709C|nr:FecR domain-containing protein [Brevundimonas sp. SORGH_AS_0993]MDQ1153423.1 transmembrane sensor [Brevundimonas sp. SORGH_AS_0993]
MTLPETADAINRTAADWAARADRGLTDAEAAELAAWLEGDSRRAGAYMRMTAVLVGTETEDSNATGAAWARRTPASGLTRRQWLVGGGAIAASVVGAGVWFGLDRQGRYVTRKGEKRVVALEDGSIVTLNTATRLEVRYSETQRLIRLADGEALFDVAKDAARPFIVRTGGVDVRAVGTSFTVTGGAGRPVKVLVREGVVEMVRPKAPTQLPMRLAANTRAVVADAASPAVIAKVEPTEVNRELAWREGRLVFAGESLSAAAAQFVRYSDTRIVVSDPVLAGSGVAGVFDANDPVGFAQAVAGSLEARAEVREGQVLVTR